MPVDSHSVDARAADPLFWSKDIGFVHVVSLNTDTYTLLSVDADGAAAIQAQADWLEKDLAAVDRQRTPWIGKQAARRRWLLWIQARKKLILRSPIRMRLLIPSCVRPPNDV